MAGRRGQFSVLGALAIVVAASASAYVFWLGYTGAGPSLRAVTLIIPRGEGAWAVAQRLFRAG